MEFNEKLQELRKRKGLTQEELAEELFVSRTAISKWESGRGYPNIDSLRSIAKFFSVTIDELLSGDEALRLAEEEQREKSRHFRALVFGLLDLGIAALLFLPFFGQRADGGVEGVSLLALTELAPHMRVFCSSFRHGGTWDFGARTAKFPWSFPGRAQRTALASREYPQRASFCFGQAALCGNVFAAFPRHQGNASLEKTVTRSVSRL